MLRYKRCLPYVTHYTRTRQSLGSWRRHAKQHVSFINFKLLELYWTYLLALQTTTPKVSPKRFMSLGHKPKMRWHTSGFVVILCKYGLLLKKPLVMSVREVIWAVSFDSLLKPNPYVDVDIVVGLWSQLMKRKYGPWIHLLKWGSCGPCEPNLCNWISYELILGFK